jgi:hypothetical protein
LQIRRRSDDGPIRLQGAHSEEPEREKYEDRISVVRGRYDRLPVRAEGGADADRRGDRMKRREFIGLLGGAAAAQQPAIPVVGFLDARSPDAMGDRLRAFRS